MQGQVPKAQIIEHQERTPIPWDCYQLLPVRSKVRRGSFDSSNAPDEPCIYLASTFEKLQYW